MQASPGPVLPVEATSVTDQSASVSDPKPVSKSALKKAAKAERYAVHKLERRAREKEAKKEKRRQKTEKRAAGELGDEDEEETKRSRKKPKVNPGGEWHGKVVVDLGFDDKMTDKVSTEIVSLCSQLAYTYSANRKASYPFSLLYTSLDGRTFTRLESMSDAGYKRWTDTEWWTEGYEKLWLTPPTTSSTSSQTGGTSDPAQNRATSSVLVDGSTSGSHRSPSDDGKNTIIYLTADSDEELSELKEDEIYIIGGICDHNRYKNLCLNKAKESGIRSARLPIGRYLASLPTRKVLTVNQVFEILLKWVETRDWEQALYSVVPKRKFQVGGKGKSNPSKGDNDPLDAAGGEEDEGQGDSEKGDEGIQGEGDALGVSGHGEDP
ncbi:hypothetical protein BDN72DRAFT_390029 [Pluteus cervinus]|uniref:Uncharacterized protein n=1 Tax=Pluteus cervinus TaxID=181527 RepID=A0ACD3B368_9AGAR|nr:hypothetical protein BDN72DRAFT_390029 [Pluteus cervinus]